MPSKPKAKGKQPVTKAAGSKRKGAEARLLDRVEGTSADPSEGHTPSGTGEWTDNARRSLNGSLADARGEDADERSTKRQRTNDALQAPHNDFALNMELNEVKRELAQKATDHEVQNIKNAVFQTLNDVGEVRSCIDSPHGLLAEVGEIKGSVDDIKATIDGDQDGLYREVAEIKESVDDIKATIDGDQDGLYTEVAEIKESVDDIKACIKDEEDGLYTEVAEIKESVDEIRSYIVAEDGLHAEVARMKASLDVIQGTIDMLAHNVEGMVGMLGGYLR